MSGREAVKGSARLILQGISPKEEEEEAAAM